jgi:SAM-dependent methyltransferase
MIHNESELAAIYSQRFEGRTDYRNRVWQVLIKNFFQKYVPADAAVLDLGCGYGEFINNVSCRAKFGMDMNPNTAKALAPNVRFLRQDCSTNWNIPDASLDIIFTSNFFEHLPDKRLLASTLVQAHRALRPGGKFIMLGPNIKYLPGAYWDFWDHYLPLTELSMQEGLKIHGFELIRSIDRFLPYTMARDRQYPVLFLKFYLKIPLVWRFFGKQFLLIAKKTSVN